MATRERVLSILRGTEASRIRFSFPVSGGSLTVRRRTFNRVARAVASGNINITVSTTFAAGVGALYHPDTNTIETPPVIGRVNEGLLLHEAVHASFDIERTAITAVDDEAACYVVDALYFRMTGLARPRWDAGLHGAAGDVADGLLAQYQAGNTPVPAVDAGLWHLLRAFIIMHPVYIGGPTSSGGSYLHNG